MLFWCTPAYISVHQHSELRLRETGIATTRHLIVTIPVSIKLQSLRSVRARVVGAGGKACTGARVSVHTPTESICDLASALCARAGHGSWGVCGLSFLYVFRTVYRHACVVTHTPVTSAERRVGGAALMTMPFGHVGIEHVSIRFIAHHARAPLDSCRVRSPRLSSHVKTHFLLPPSSLPPWPHHPFVV